MQVLITEAEQNPALLLKMRPKRPKILLKVRQGHFENLIPRKD